MEKGVYPKSVPQQARAHVFARVVQGIKAGNASSDPKAAERG